ncbi:4'-phosphopantetheinyl transferase family protein [Actinacidiphila yeochonensis]|uniref:4'-phosphopantetheinyl transferase family protein n=1 Tax=Actinacidiphila yeochonensis TaxID=89050 RepID=UPI00068B3C9C|nr:4'-phosphopantetheinyl transferase superfamily protein [Actinacidiphila yeochonensis]
MSGPPTLLPAGHVHVWCVPLDAPSGPGPAPGALVRVPGPAPGSRRDASGLRRPAVGALREPGGATRRAAPPERAAPDEPAPDRARRPDPGCAGGGPGQCACGCAGPGAVWCAADWLDAEERARAARTAPGEPRRRYVHSHAAVRMITAGYLGTPPERVVWRRGPNGKPVPVVDGAALHVNLSHSGGLALFAVARREVGVDVEAVRVVPSALRLAARFLPEEEAAAVAAAGPGRSGILLRLLARKEACVKASGGRLTHGLRLPVGEPPTPDGWRPVAGTPGGGPGPGRWSVRDLPVPAGYTAAVAVLGAGRPRLSVRTWTGFPSP